MIRRSKLSASLGCLRANARRVMLVFFHTPPHPTTRRCVSTSRTAVATRTTADSPTFGSAHRLRIARHSGWWDTVKRVQTALSFMRTSVHTFQTPVAAGMVTSVDWAMSIARLACAKLLASLQTDCLPQRAVPGRTRMMLTLNLGLLAPLRIPISSRSSTTMSPSMLTIEQVAYRNAVGLPSSARFPLKPNLLLLSSSPVPAYRLNGRSVVRFAVFSWLFHGRGVWENVAHIGSFDDTLLALNRRASSCDFLQRIW
jgi:hypothetical protein